MNTSTQLKALIRNISNAKRVNAQILLRKTQNKNVDAQVLQKALNETSKERATMNVISEWEMIVSEIESSKDLQKLWNQYRNKYEYAKDITWNEIILVTREILKTSHSSY